MSNRSRLLSKPGAWPMRHLTSAGNYVITDPERGIGLVVDGHKGRLWPYNAWFLVTMFQRTDRLVPGEFEFGHPRILDYGLN